jgi:hypothetical protein
MRKNNSMRIIYLLVMLLTLAVTAYAEGSGLVGR